MINTTKKLNKIYHIHNCEHIPNSEYTFLNIILQHNKTVTKQWNRQRHLQLFLIQNDQTWIKLLLRTLTIKLEFTVFPKIACVKNTYNYSVHLTQSKALFNRLWTKLVKIKLYCSITMIWIDKYDTLTPKSIYQTMNDNQ